LYFINQNNRNTIYWGVRLSKHDLDLLKEAHPVGVVMRSDAPLVARLLAENDHSGYAIAVDQPRTVRRWITGLSFPFFVTLVSLLDTIKITK